MALASQYSEVYLAGDGVTTTFAFDFEAISANYIKCIVYFENGVGVVPTYSVAPSLRSITIVSLTTPDGEVLQVPPVGSQVRIFRDIPEEQNVTEQALKVGTAKQLEKALDNVVGMIQENKYDLDHKVIRTTETMRDVSLDNLEKATDGAMLYWQEDGHKIKATEYSQDKPVLSDTVKGLEYDEISGKIEFTLKDGGDPKPAGEGIIHNDLKGRNAPDCHPESAITGLVQDLQDLADADDRIEAKADEALETANSADAKADQAIETADTAITTAREADSRSQQALTNSQQAIETSEDAKQKAIYAVDTAEDAESTANTALTTAQSADAKADTAITTANEASETATDAYNKSVQVENIVDSYGDIVTHDADEFATSAQGIKADTALQATDVIDNVTSIVTDKPLSANMGKELQDQIDNLQGRGRFLSVWDATTGLPTTEPETELPYEYHTGDYYIVGTVGTTNYKPEGTEYTGDPSTTVETNEVKQNDTYFYDGTDWSLVSTPEKEVSFSSLAGSPYDNVNLAGAFNNKANSEDNITITQNASDKIQAVGLIDKNPNATTPVYDWVGTLAEYQAQQIRTTHPEWLCFITDDSETLNVYTKDETDALLDDKQDTLTAGTGINISNNQISAVKGEWEWVGTGTNSIEFGNDADALASYTIAIGNSAAATAESTIAIGDGAKVEPNGAGSVALGQNAQVYTSYAVQLGSGSNQTSGSLQFRSYQLLNSSGIIPADRLSTNTGAGKILVRMGSNSMAWENFMGCIPDQTDNAGKFLTTDGEQGYWADIDVPKPTYDATTKTISF